MTPSEVIAAARSWIGTPYKHQERIKGQAVDCAGLIVCVLKECGYPIDDRKDYGTLPISGELRAELKKRFKRVYEPAPGDIIEMSLAGYPHHLGFYTDSGTLIHAMSSEAFRIHKVLEVGYREPWLSRTRGIWRIPEFC